MLLRLVTIALFGIACGIVSALCAVGFVWLIDLLNQNLLISARSRMIAKDSAWLPIATVIVPTIGGLLVGLLWRFIPERRPHAPPDAIQAVQTGAGLIPLKSGLLTALGSVISLGSGAAVGQYGPLVHLGSTLGSSLGAMLSTATQQSLGNLRIIGIGCGSAAVIATVFNAPIAGLVFAHEVILRHFSLRTFAPVTVATVSGYLIANVLFERPPLFRIEPLSLMRAEEFLGFILIGFGGALLAVCFMRTVLLAGRLAATWQCPPVFKPAAAGLVLGLVALALPDVLGVGKEVLRFAIIENAFEPTELAVLIIAKLLLTALCIGFGFAGGVFSPALLIGILFGALVGSTAEWVWGSAHSPVALYAICGMVAVTSPVIGAPLTMILIVFELTRNYDLTITAMVSLVFANAMARHLFGPSLFDVQLARRGLDLSLGRDKVILDHRLIDPYISSSFTQVAPDWPLARVKAALLAAQHTEAYVVDNNGRYCGTLTLHRLLALEQQGLPLSAEQARPESLVLSAGTSIWAAMEQLGDFVGESIPVVQSDTDAKLLGVVFEATLIKAYLETLYDLRREEHAAN